jgi:pseudouridine-5'-phosphate glycosidase/pseudouridine kinase
VARNIAEAAHRLSPPNSIILVSPVGGDAFGNLLVQETNSIGMRTDGLALQSDHATSVCNMTLALNGELEHGVADMGITRAWSSSEVLFSVHNSSCPS